MSKPLYSRDVDRVMMLARIRPDGVYGAAGVTCDGATAGQVARGWPSLAVDHGGQRGHHCGGEQHVHF